MIEEGYVSFELARLLREKGFNEPCNSRFYKRTPEGEPEVYHTSIREDFNRGELRNTWSRPTLQMVLLWLHGNGIHPCVNWHISANKYYAKITGKANADYSVGLYEKLEESWQAIIRYSLENLL